MVKPLDPDGANKVLRTRRRENKEIDRISEASDMFPLVCPRCAGTGVVPACQEMKDLTVTKIVELTRRAGTPFTAPEISRIFNDTPHKGKRSPSYRKSLKKVQWIARAIGVTTDELIAFLLG